MCLFMIICLLSEVDVDRVRKTYPVIWERLQEHANEKILLEKNKNLVYTEAVKKDSHDSEDKTTI